jgi:hypothetical protein
VVPLPHPRHYAVKTTPPFAALKAELTEPARWLCGRRGCEVLAKATRAHA